MKKKGVAGILALLFGIFGVHRFYLGQRFRGIIMFVAFVLAMVATVESGIPFIAFLALVAFIDAILFFVMPESEFNAKYNRGVSMSTRTSAAPFRNYKTTRTGKNYRKVERTYSNPLKNNPYKSEGIALYKDYEYEEAVDAFKKSLKLNYEDPAVHFNLACCYSILEKPDLSFFHLDKAVAFGFKDFDKINNHDALAFLRTQEEFDGFAANQYQLTPQIAAPKEDLLQQPLQLLPEDKVFEKIASLGELRDKGFLTDEEFTAQKKRLLERRR